MKIGVVCPYDLSLPGGVQNIVLQMHHRLTARGHKAKIITVKPERKIVVKGVTFFGKANPISWNGAISSFNLGSIATDREVTRYMQQEKFDVLVIHEPLIPWLNIEMLNYSGVPKIGWFHATTINNPWDFPAKLVAEPVQMWLRSKLSGMIAISTSARQVWKKVFGREGVVISGGVDWEKFALAQPAAMGQTKTVKLLYLGRLDERKGILDLIRAVGLISGTTNVELWIAGDGPQMQEAWNLAMNLGLGGKVRFVGRVNNEDVAGYFKATDIYCAPSWGGESLGLVLLEAMAAGAPIVAYANPGYKYTLQGYPWKKGLVPVKSVKKLAEAVSELAENSELRMKLSEWGRERSRDYDWEVMVDKFLEYVGKIIISGKTVKI